jgi:hypothetical protein
MGQDVPSAEILHSIDGRTRLRVPARAGDAPFFAALADSLVALDGVIAVRTRPLIGSVLVFHDGAFADIAARVKAANLVAIEKAAAPSPAAASARTAHAPAAGALAMGALGVFQLFQQRVLPPAITLFWYALTLAREAQAADHAEDDGGDGE